MLQLGGHSYHRIETQQMGCRCMQSSATAKQRTKDISPQVRIPSTSKRMDRLAGARSTAAAVFLRLRPLMLSGV